ncbi:diguanylate cyclase [Roseateles sp.]|uniref:diguanylate cyclase n=1 Tax=Roseateles sp. TaxID=1971397 RepID=UPI0039EB0952
MIFDIIRQQVEILRRPLAAVVLSTLPRRSSPMLLLLHWHGFAVNERMLPPGQDFSNSHSRESLPSSALQLNQTWTQLEQLDQQMLDAAWQLGAWDLVREEHRGCNVVGASVRETVACRQAFGDNPLKPEDEAHLTAEAPDRDAMKAMAAKLGYVRWLFRPVADGLWRGAGQDDSLLAGGGRLPPCPVAPVASVGTRISRSSYQLGRIDRIVLI